MSGTPDSVTPPATAAGTPAPERAGSSPEATKASPEATKASPDETSAPRPGGGPAPPPPRRMVASLSHDLQLGLAVLLGDGYRGIFPYQTMIDCGDAKDPTARVCTNRAPPFVDVQPSFGLSNAWDFLVDVRFGLEADFNLHHQFFVMPGFRYWLDPQSHVKFFTTMQLAYDRSAQNSTRVGDNDLGFRNANGLMVEVMRNFGVYAQFGETVGFVRWLSFLVDAGIGVQARVP